MDCGSRILDLLRLSAEWRGKREPLGETLQVDAHAWTWRGGCGEGACPTAPLPSATEPPGETDPDRRSHWTRQCSVESEHFVTEVAVASGKRGHFGPRTEGDTLWRCGSKPL